jgi:AraC family transcriptional regulator, positive regulator of tynA and feaB
LLSTRASVRTMSHLFCTDLIPVSDRLDAWLWNARQICGNCQFHFHKHHPFHGSIDRRKIGDFEFTLFSSSALSFEKVPQSSLQAENSACIVITQLAGLREYRQAGKVAVLKKGDTTVIDSAVPWSSECGGDCRRLYLRVPRLLVERKLVHVQIPFATRIAGTKGLGAALFQLVTSLHQQAEELTQEDADVAINAYLNILSACMGGSLSARGTEHHGAQLLNRIDRFIEDHLSQTGLCPAEIATAFGISVRHLHRLFSHRGFTVAHWIRAQRLKRCWQDLSDPRLREKSITEIAFFWGFNDSAHFSHSFKEEFGICPRSFRSGHWSPSAARLNHAFDYFHSQGARRAKAS